MHMLKRLQVLLDAAEHRLLQRAAKAKHLTTAEYVRQMLREGTRQQSLVDPKRKMASLKKSVTYDFPTADVDQMLAEIERGYGEDI